MNINVNKHSSICIGDIYIDPFKIDVVKNDARYIFITHSHYDHLSFDDIEKVVNKDTVFVSTRDVIEKIRKKYNNRTIEIEINKKYDLKDISFETFPSYNVNKNFHPFNNGWVGYIINIENVSYAVLGDTDVTEEAKNIKCDVLFIPIGGTYTMNAKEASELANIINPKLVIPVHYNDIVGNKEDEKVFLNGIKCEYKLFL